MKVPSANTSREGPSDPLDLLRHAAHPLRGSGDNFDPLIRRIGDAPLVLLGEATHGTHEFYEARARITQRLIEEQGFNAVAVEADWPDAYRINRWVQGRGADSSAEQALEDFQRFPQWMWRNTEVVRFIEWLHQHNASRPAGERVGFFGLDLYSLHASIQAVIDYLEKVDPEAAARTRARYSCFDHSLEEPSVAAQQYGYQTTLGVRPSCEEAAVQQLVELRARARQYLQRDGFIAQDEQFFAEQNALLVANAEEYYRGMFAGASTPGTCAINTWPTRSSRWTST